MGTWASSYSVRLTDVFVFRRDHTFLDRGRVGDLLARLREVDVDRRLLGNFASWLSPPERQGEGEGRAAATKENSRLLLPNRVSAAIRENADVRRVYLRGLMWAI